MKEIIEEQTELPTAVFACNDMTAIGAMEAIRSHGLSVPRISASSVLTTLNTADIATRH